MEDQRREWALRDKKQKQQNDARAALMRRVYEIRDEQIKFRGAENQREIHEAQQERNRILQDVQSFRDSEEQRNQGHYYYIFKPIYKPI